jgi:hypothetical protein
VKKKDEVFPLTTIMVECDEAESDVDWEVPSFDDEQYVSF